MLASSGWTPLRFCGGWPQRVSSAGSAPLLARPRPDINESPSRARWQISSATSEVDPITLVYFDSSTLVKLVVDEEGSELAAALWDGCDAAVASRLAYPEVHAALAAAARSHQLSVTAYVAASRAWDTFWSAVHPVELTASVEQAAGRLARAHALRGADAVHLASALALLPADLVLAAWDRRLRAGAEAAALPLAPLSLADR